MPDRPVYEARFPTTEQQQELNLRRRLELAQTLDSFRKDSSERSYLLKTREALRTERQTPVVSFDIGDRVLRYIGNQKKSRLDPNFDGPWIVHGVNSNGSYALKAISGHLLKNMTNKDALIPANDAKWRTGRWMVSKSSSS